MTGAWKQYARVRRTSLSRIVEEYFRRLGGQDISTSTETPVLNEITGLLVAKGGPTPEEMCCKCRKRRAVKVVRKRRVR